TEVSRWIETDFRAHPHRHRWLELQALARNVLSLRPDAGARTGVRQQPVDFDRDQQHVLRSAEAGELPEMADAGAGRIRFRGEGTEVRNQPAGARRCGRLDQALPQSRRHEVAIVLAADSKYPQILDDTAPFVYARLMGSSPEHESGY